MKVTKVILLPDMQFPQQDDRAIAVAMKIVKAYRPHIVINLGDVVACDSVGSYAKANYYEALLTLKGEIESANKGLDSQDKAFKQAGVKKKILLEGNHEARIAKWVANNAMNLGNMEELSIPNLLQLKERGYVYVPLSKQPLELGKADIFHGDYVNMYHASKTIKETGRNSIYGHTHDYQAYISSHRPDDLPKIAMSCGCLCRFDQAYIGRRATKWVHGVGIMEYLDDGFFTCYFIPIIGYRCVFNGKEIKA